MNFDQDSTNRRSNVHNELKAYQIIKILYMMNHTRMNSFGIKFSIESVYPVFGPMILYVHDNTFIIDILGAWFNLMLLIKPGICKLTGIIANSRCILIATLFTDEE